MNQKFLTVLSIVGVIAGAAAVNQLVLKSNSEDQDRQVASFGERFEPNQIKWEQELANTISKDEQSKTVLGVKPTLQDKLLYEVFEGRYQLQLSQGKINRISLLPNQAPLEISTAEFMQEYAAVLKEFDSYSLGQPSGREDSVQLKNKSGAIIGNLKINRDDQGRVLAIEVQ